MIVNDESKRLLYVCFFAKEVTQLHSIQSVPPTEDLDGSYLKISNLTWEGWFTQNPSSKEASFSSSLYYYTDSAPCNADMNRGRATCMLWFRRARSEFVPDESSWKA